MILTWKGKGGRLGISGKVDSSESGEHPDFTLSLSSCDDQGTIVYLVK